MPPKQSIDLVNAIQEAAEQPLNQSLLLGLAGYNCRRAYVSIMQLFQKRMEKFDLRQVDFTVLSLVRANPNISQKRLSEAIDVSQPNLATLLDRLENRDLLVRQRNPLDKRSQTLVLTADGVALCLKAEKTAIDLDRKATAALTDAEREQLLQFLQKLFPAD
jgi:DNA-binding MarR family transcriptional regulator